MRRVLLIVSLSALLMASVPDDQAGASQRRVASGARWKAAEVAAIEAYCKRLERYFQSNPKSTRFFVDSLPEGGADASLERIKNWYEVKTADEMYEAAHAYAFHSAIVSTKDGEIVYANVGEPQEHSSHDNGYYFRSGGTLAKISSDFYSNMQEIHVERENFYDPNGRLLKTTARCFNIKYTSQGSREKRVSCRRDEMSAELADYQIPVYKRSTDLPAYELLKKR